MPCGDSHFDGALNVLNGIHHLAARDLPRGGAGQLRTEVATLATGKEDRAKAPRRKDAKEEGNWRLATGWTEDA